MNIRETTSAAEAGCLAAEAEWPGAAGCLAAEAVDSRPAGTCELSPCRTLASSLNLARDKGAEAVLVFDKDGERMVRV